LGTFVHRRLHHYHPHTFSSSQDDLTPTLTLREERNEKHVRPVLTIVAGDLNTPPGVLAYRLVRDVGKLTDCWSAVHGQDEWSVDRSDWFPQVTLQQKEQKMEGGVPGATFGTSDNLWSKGDISGECRLDFVFYNKDDCDKRWQCTGCDVFKRFVDLRKTDVYSNLDENLPLNEKCTKNEERKRREAECIPISDHWGVLAEFKFNNNDGERRDLQERESTETEGKNHWNDADADLALKEGVELLLDGIIDGQDRRTAHTALGFSLLCATLFLLWADPLAWLGYWCWLLSRLLVTILLPLAIAELILGLMAVSDEIQTLRQTVVEMDLARGMDPHFFPSSIASVNLNIGPPFAFPSLSRKVSGGNSEAASNNQNHPHMIPSLVRKSSGETERGVTQLFRSSSGSIAGNLAGTIAVSNFGNNGNHNHASS